MASTILYKFQSGTTFEALPLPGSAARLFDVKKAIVRAKKLDNSGSMEFDLAVRNADTNEEYVNESMLLPRGTRLIVQRLPAPRGHGFLARMARNEHAGVIAGPPGGAHHQPVVPGSAPSGFYTIDSRTRDDEEFVSSGAPAAAGGGGDDERELAALKAATSVQSTGPTMTGGGYTGGPSRGGGPPRGPPGGGGMGGGPPKAAPFRPNADPELRDQEKQMMPKKRATGIPRTFLNLNAPPQTEGGAAEGEDSNVPLLQPNALGFKELVNRGGGLSETIAGTRRDLDYALKLTATSVPEHLQCAIHNGVVKNAMILPWDPEGRTTCETCIRDALTQNGFRCPLTGQDGVSPDDLIPNIGLRKAAELFIKGVMEKVDEIEKQQVEEAETTVDTTKSAEANVLDGDGVEKGVIVSKKMTLANKKKDSDDPFGGGEDDFGGDVFAVEIETPNDEAAQNVKAETEAKDESANAEKAGEDKETPKEGEKPSETNTAAVEAADQQAKATDAKDVSSESRSAEGAMEAPPANHEAEVSPKPRRRERRRRGPPVGYSMGPAGTGARAMPDHGGGHFGGGRGGGRFHGGGGFRGGRGGGRGRGRFHGSGGPPGGNERDRDREDPREDPREDRRRENRSRDDHGDEDSRRGTNKRSHDDQSADGSRADDDSPRPNKRHQSSRHEDRREDRGGRPNRDDRGHRDRDRDSRDKDRGGRDRDRDRSRDRDRDRGSSRDYSSRGGGGGYRNRGSGGGNSRNRGRGGHGRNRY